MNYELRISSYFFLLTSAILFAFCCGEAKAADSDGKSIVILYDNDVHCAIDGYTRLAGLRDAIAQSDTAWTGIVGSGDFLQGGTFGALSRGQFILDVMRNVGYDAVTLGNHEFDYGVEHMQQLLSQLKAPVVCANFYRTDAAAPVYAPYVICSYGNRRVAYVGVLTPETMKNEAYAFYDNDGRQIYDLRTDDFTRLVQAAVDEARGKGADYVVALSHMGEEIPALGITSHQMVAATRGIDVVFDGHTHSVIPCDEVANLDGKAVPVTQTGTQFAYVGKLLITAAGNISTTLIPTGDITYENATVTATIDSIRTKLKEVTARRVGQTGFALTILDDNGNNMVRHTETNLGDLVADAFRQTVQAEIGCYNAGGIRNGVGKGTITYGDVVDMLPYDNHVAKIEATGRQILDMLAKCTATLPENDGQFPQVSGMRYTVHQRSHTVSDVSVYDSAASAWQPIDPGRRYTVAVSDYCLNGGFYDVLKDCRQLVVSNQMTRDDMADYIQKALGGTIPAEYAQPQGRITIVDD